MHVTLPDKSLGIRVALSTLLCLCAILIRLMERVWLLLPPHPMWEWVVVLLMIAGVGMALLAFFGPFQCRKCGSWIRRAELAEGTRIHYRCVKCKIIWDTGWRVPWDLTS